MNYLYLHPHFPPFRVEKIHITAFNSDCFHSAPFLNGLKPNPSLLGETVQQLSFESCLELCKTQAVFKETNRSVTTVCTSPLPFE